MLCQQLGFAREELARRARGDLPEDAVQPGDRAEFFGPNVALDEVAAAAGTIGYELLTGLGSRVNRNWMELIWQKNA